jgi:hypothetical protein
MKKLLFLVAAIAATVVLIGCWPWTPLPQAHGYPDIPWYLTPFLYCFLGSVIP